MFRPYDPERDREAALRIYKEVGWFEPGDDELTIRWIQAGRALVAEVGGGAECMVTTAPGSMRYLEHELPIGCVTGVTTSHVARKQGLASRLAAKAVAADAHEGAMVSALGCFDQGYYDRLGFGIGPYEIAYAFDPARLQVPELRRPPVRVTADDWEQAHAARLARRRLHGSVSLHSADLTRAEMKSDPKQFGLGFRDDAGSLTHLMWLRSDDIGSGPVSVSWMAYRDGDDLLDLLGILRGLGDQILTVKMTEPPRIQLQDLLKQPARMRQLTENAKFEERSHASAYIQYRICDLPGCLAQTHLPYGGHRFNLQLTDPIEHYLDHLEPWPGV